MKELINLIKQLYGDDIFNIIFKIILEMFQFVVVGIFGAVIKEMALRDKEITASDKVIRILYSSFLSAIILTVMGGWLYSKLQNYRLIFGINILLSMFIPNIIPSIKSGKFFISITKLINEKLGNFIKEIEEERETQEKIKENKKGQRAKPKD